LSLLAVPTAIPIPIPIPIPIAVAGFAIARIAVAAGIAVVGIPVAVSAGITVAGVPIAVSAGIVVAGVPIAVSAGIVVAGIPIAVSAGIAVAEIPVAVSAGIVIAGIPVAVTGCIAVAGIPVAVSAGISAAVAVAVPRIRIAQIYGLTPLVRWDVRCTVHYALTFKGKHRYCPRPRYLKGRSLRDECLLTADNVHHKVVDRVLNLHCSAIHLNTCCTASHGDTKARAFYNCCQIGSLH
jgi:hypothetical protein